MARTNPKLIQALDSLRGLSLEEQRTLMAKIIDNHERKSLDMSPNRHRQTARHNIIRWRKALIPALAQATNWRLTD